MPVPAICLLKSMTYTRCSQAIAWHFAGVYGSIFRPRWRAQRSYRPCRISWRHVAMAYLAFALRHPALYEAMFILPTNLRFAQAETRPELRAAFEAISAVVTPFCVDAETATETFWAAIHGLYELERSGRNRPSARVERIDLVVRALIGIGESPRADHSPLRTFPSARLDALARDGRLEIRGGSARDMHVSEVRLPGVRRLS